MDIQNKTSWDLLCRLHPVVWCLQLPHKTIAVSAGWTQAYQSAENSIPTELTQWIERVHPDDRALVESHIGMICLDQSQSIGMEFRFQDHTGTYHWISAKGVSQDRKLDNDLLEIFFIEEDISEQQKIREELLNSQSNVRRVSLFLKQTIDASADPIFAKDEDHRWILLNDAMCKLFGIEREEVLGKTDISFFNVEHADVFRDIDRRVFETEKPIENIENFTDKSGKTHVISTKKSIFLDSSGKKVLVCITRDITDRMAFERRLKQSLYEIESQRQQIEAQAQQLKLQATDLRQARDKAQAVSHAKSTFLANMSHEIRTPLNGVIGMTELLKDTPLNQEQKEFVHTLQQSAHSLLFLINDILDFSKIEAGKFELYKEPFDLFVFLKNFNNMLVPLIADKKIKLSIQKPPDLLRFVLADKERLRQILLNLVANAIKFTPKDGAVYIATASTPISDTQFNLRFSITDTGIGIPAKQQKDIFSAFEQADSSVTRQYGGTGLGLAICKELVQLMGGTLTLESNPGEGSTFTFNIPVRAARAEAVVEKIQEPTVTTTRPLSILVAEDNKTNQLLIATLLQKEGHQVTIAEDGLKAIELFKSQTFDLILMDIQMPNLSGDKAFEQIRTLPFGASVPVIALTAHALTGDRIKYLNMGMNGYVSKPINRSLLLKTINDVTAEKKQPSSNGTQEVAYYIR